MSSRNAPTCLQVDTGTTQLKDVSTYTLNKQILLVRKSCRLFVKPRVVDIYYI